MRYKIGYTDDKGDLITWDKIPAVIQHLIFLSFFWGWGLGFVVCALLTYILLRGILL